jgi:hypothetical protein
MFIAAIALFVALHGGATAPQQVTRTSASAPLITYTPLTLQNGWTGAPFGTRIPAVAKDSSGTVHFEGAMATAGTNPIAFTLPVAFRPAADVYVTVDMFKASNGRLFIASTGVVTVEPENGTFSNAQGFTSLDGVVFTK